MDFLTNSNIIVGIATFLGIVSASYLFRTSYIDSLKDKNQELNDILGKNINRLASLNHHAERLELKNAEQLKELETSFEKYQKLSIDSKKTATYKNHFQSLMIENKRQKAKLEKIESYYQNLLQTKSEELKRISGSYEKVTHSFEVIENNIENLRSEKDFYRQELIRLREQGSLPDNVQELSIAELKVG